MIDDKALGLDGFNNKFFKASWLVLGPNIVNAIHEFFENCKLLKTLKIT